MEVTSVEKLENGTYQAVIGKVKMSIPVDSKNRHYRAVQGWIAEGNTPSVADETPTQTLSEKIADRRANDPLFEYICSRLEELEDGLRNS